MLMVELTWPTSNHSLSPNRSLPAVCPLFPISLLEIRLIVVKGPMFNDAHPTEGKPANFKGSMMIFRAATEAEVREILSNDVYGKGNVWDLENMQIIPVSPPVPWL